MDLLDTLRKKLEVLEGGDYTSGLKAVVLHIETAFRHLARGQDSGDDTAFTDAIYRTNQAFEGSIKEAYRVLAGKDPQRLRPFDIENYLEQQQVFRSRVLSQFTTYRREWRNPSTHDHKLDFDESEAFLAIVSVAAFACLLFDQIAEQLAYLKTQAEAQARREALARSLAATKDGSLLKRVVGVIQQFCLTIGSDHEVPPRQTESQLVGSLHGFFAAAAPDLHVATEVRVPTDHRLRIDLLVSTEDERLVVEVKRNQPSRNLPSNAIHQVTAYMMAIGAKSSVVLFAPETSSELEVQQLSVGTTGFCVVLLKAKASQ